MGKTYNITGAEALLHGEIAEKLSTAFNRSIQCVDVSPESMREAFRSIGFPAWQADGVIEDYAHYSLGEAAETTSGVRGAIGRVLHSFDVFARDYAPAFT